MPSVFDDYQPRTLTVTATGTVDPDNPYGGVTAGASATSTARFARSQARVKLADGTYELAKGVAVVTAAVVVPEGCTVTVSGESETFTVMARETVPDVWGEAQQQKVYLG
jgi:hypothetical protein